MKLKVCGLSNPIELETCVSTNVDYCGFILNYTRSHRYISLDKAKELTKINKGNAKYVGVLVEPTIEQLKKFSQLDFDYFQLYGNFHPDELIKIKDKFKYQNNLKKIFFDDSNNTLNLVFDRSIYKPNIYLLKKKKMSSQEL